MVRVVVERRGCPLLLTGQILLLTATGAYAAGFRDDYRAAKTWVERGDWERALSSLQSAIRDRPDSGRVLGLGRYVPHYYLGVVLSELDRCAGALGSFAESERQGTIRALEVELADLKRRRSRCEARVAEIQEARRGLKALVDGSRATRLEVEELLKEPALPGDVADAIEPRFSQTLQKLEQAADVLVSSNPRFDRVQEGTTIAASSKAALDAIKAELEQALSTARRQAADQKSRLEGLVRTGQRLLTSTQWLSPYPRRVSAARQKMTLALKEWERLSTVGGVSLDNVERQLDSALRELRAVTAPPPSELQEAAALYLGGDYAAVLQQLEEESFSSSKAKAQACLLRSAASYRIWELSESRDDELLEAAKAATHGCSEMADRVNLDAKLFSPAFRRFWAAQVVP